MNRINIFFLPFAGGNIYSYRKYEELLPSFLKVIPLEYPGHGTRMQEPLAPNLDFLVEDLYRQIKGQVDNKKYAFYGHSMGGTLSYCLTRKILENNHRPPVHLFITGTDGPSAITKPEKIYHKLDRDKFIAKIIELKGMPEEILKNEELMDMYEPILRADFMIGETYPYQEYVPLNVPFTVITGTEEEMTLEDIALWQKETKYKVDFRRMSGNHFFIFEHLPQIIQIISNKLIYA